VQFVISESDAQMVFLGGHPAKNEPPTSVCALLCPVLIIAAHLGNKVIFDQLSPQTLLVTVNSCNVTQTILSPSVPETVCQS